MNVEIVGRVASTLPADDDHPYRTGAWQPNFVEYDATDLDVVGEIPDDLDGVYLRNTENPVHPSIDRLYHPFDGDGMLHMMRFADGQRRVPQPLRAHRRLRSRAGGRARVVERHSRQARRIAPTTTAGVRARA